MRKSRLVAAGAVTLLVAACTDTKSPVAPELRAPTDRPSFVIGSGSGASFTTISSTDLDPSATPPITEADLCKNGNPDVNCNLYGSKDYVWMNGGPDGAGLDDGDYFFAVLAPGGQADPNDNTPNNLSDAYGTPGAGDSYQNRTFSVSGGVVSYSGSHDQDGNKIRLMVYDDTPNPGGVYILAICTLEGGYPVAPRRCKYDAFKAPTGTPGGGENQADAPLVIKDANPAYDKTFTWGIDKSVDKTEVQQTSGNVTFTYTVAVTHDAGTVSNVVIAGTITAVNPNADNITGASLSDVLKVQSSGDPTGTCTVNGGTTTGLTLVPGDNTYAYSCALTSLPTEALSNTVTLTWGGQTLGTKTLDAGSANWIVTDIEFEADDATLIDDSADITDLFNNGSVQNVGDLTNPTGTSTVSYTDPSPTNFIYTRTIAVVAGCVKYDNTATYTTDHTTGSDPASVTVCGPVLTGAHTIGFWKGPNGNSLILNYCSNSTTLATYLSLTITNTGSIGGPFADAAGKSCSQLVTYVNGVLTGASATDMNKMLRAQMLGTALDVYFSSFGWSNVNKGTTKNPIKAPSVFGFTNTNGGVGAFVMDLTAVCPMVDNLNTGAASCKNGTPSTDGFAAGAFPSAAMSVNAILAFASTAPSAGSYTPSGTTHIWYSGNRTKQEILKNVFDQINNQLAFAP